jgi:ABC-type lipoprotein export system ATPase subunit
MNDCLVDAIDIDRNFPDGESNFVTVLKSVRCHIQARDRIALTGPSGSGKSTLLHILGGLDEPSEGTVTWPSLGARESLRPEKVAYVFQTQSLFSALTVLENVALPMVMIDREEEGNLRAAAILEAFELDNLATKLPEELSGGQAQRISLARALITH